MKLMKFEKLTTWCARLAFIWHTTIKPIAEHWKLGKTSRTKRLYFQVQEISSLKVDYMFYFTIKILY